MPVNDRADIEWAPKVSLAKIRQLYVKEAQGICEDELIDDVGLGLYFRCESIIEYTEAVQHGRVRCKRCARLGNDTIIKRESMKPTELLKCPVCAWQIRWRVYVREAEKASGNLHWGNAQAAFERYLQTYPQCTTSKEKIVAIDRLIHEFHWLTMGEDKEAEGWKPAGVNLLQGSTAQVLALLDELTYGGQAPAEVLEMRDWWLAQRNRGTRSFLRPEEGE
jgi:hypothetical protein